MTSYRDLAMAMPSQDDDHVNDEMGVLCRGNVNNIVKKFAQHANQNNPPPQNKMQSNKRGQPLVNTKNTRYDNNSNLSANNSTYENNRSSTSSTNNSNTEQTTSSLTDNMVDRKINSNRKGNSNVRSANTAIKQPKNQQDTTPDLFKIKLKKVGIEKLLQKDEDSRKGSAQDQQSSDNNSSQSGADTLDIKPIPKRTNNYDQPDERSSDPLPDSNRQQSSYQHDDDNVIPASLNDTRGNSNISNQIQNKMIADETDQDEEEENKLPSRRNQNPKSDITNPSSKLSNFTKANYVPPPAPDKQADQLIEPKVNNPDSLSQKSKPGGNLIYSFAKTGKKKGLNNVQVPNKSQNDKSSYDFHGTSGSKVNNRSTKNNTDDTTTDLSSSLNTTTSKKNINNNSFSNFAKKKSSTATPQKNIPQQNNSELQITNDNKQPSSPKSNLKSSSNSEGKAHVNVTFSNSQPQVDYTYSPNEYERVIDIDAGLNEAQFEVEKSLRNMDLTTVQLNKYDKSLGITIKKVWIGENREGDDLMSVYVDSIVPGGIADQSNNVRVGDLIVEIGQNSLVAAAASDIGKALSGLNGVVKFVLGREKAKKKSNEAVVTENKTNINTQQDKQKVSTVRPTITKPNLTPAISLPNKKVKESVDDKETTMNIQQKINPAPPTVIKPNLAPEVSHPSKKVNESSDEDDESESDSSVEGTYHFGNDASDEVSADEETTTVQSPKQKENITIASMAKPAFKNQTDNTKQKSTVFNNIENKRENKLTTSTQNQKGNKSIIAATDPNASLVSATEHAANLERIKNLEKELQEAKVALSTAQSKFEKNTANVEQIKSLEAELRETKATLNITESKLAATTNKIAEFEKSSNQVLALEKKVLEDQIDTWKNRAESAEKRLSVVEVERDSLKSNLQETKRQSVLLQEQFVQLKEQVLKSNTYKKETESTPDDSDESLANGSSEENSAGPPKPPRGKRTAPPIPVSPREKSEPEEATNSESDLAEEQSNDERASIPSNRAQQPSSATDSFQHYSKSHPDMFVEKKKNIFHKLKFGRKAKKGYDFSGANSEVPTVDNSNDDAPATTVGAVTVRKNRDEMF